MQKEENNLTCNVLTGRAGCGKTRHMLGGIVIQPGRYILAAPRKELLEEHAETLREMSRETSTALIVECIHSDQSAREAVGRRITDALQGTAPDVHTAISITHQALFELDPHLLAGWHIRIDELPEGGIVSGSVKLSASWHTLAAHYDLKASNLVGWSVASLRNDVDELQLSDITGDVAEKLVSLHRVLTTPTRTVYINIKEWKDASIKRRVVKWYSIWSPADLSGCASLSITAANYQGSLVDHAIRKADTLNVKTCPVDSHIERTQNPQIRIHYYTKHAGSTTWWETDDGSYCLVQICSHLEATGFQGFWTSNEAVRPYFRHRLGENWCLPKQAGSNSLRHHADCAMIYSAKAQIADEPVLEVLGLDRSEIQASREDEDLYQFVMRGAIRMHDFVGQYNVHVYDQSQAERLQRRLIEQDFTDVELIPVVDAGVMEVVRPEPAAKGISFQDDAAYIAERREQKLQKDRERSQRKRDVVRAAKKAAGTLKPLGRPKKSSAPV